MVGNRNNYIYIYHKQFKRPTPAIQVYDTSKRKDDKVTNNKSKECVNDKNKKKTYKGDRYDFRKETGCFNDSHQANVEDNLLSQCRIY